MSFILSLIGEFFIGLFSGLAGGTLQDLFKYLSKLGRHI
jgi:hypothetical protein